MLREYEFTLIARGDLGDQDRAKVFEGYEKYMLADGGKILRRNDWGNKRLSYPMKKCFRGHYINYDFVGTRENLAEMERLMRIDDNVLRYMAVRLDDGIHEVDTDKRLEQLSKQEAAEKEAAEKKRH